MDRGVNHYFDVEPLLAIARRRWKEIQPAFPFTDIRLAKMLHTNGDQIRRWKDKGIFFTQAERTCEYLDLMPHEIWPEYWAVVDDYYEKRGVMRKEWAARKRRSVPK